MAPARCIMRHPSFQLLATVMDPACHGNRSRRIHKIEGHIYACHPYLTGTAPIYPGKDHNRPPIFTFTIIQCLQRTRIVSVGLAAANWILRII